MKTAILSKFKNLIYSPAPAYQPPPPSDVFSPDQMKKLDEQMRYGKEVPPQWRFTYPMSDYRAFTWKERFQILLGYGLFVDTKILTVNSPGKLARQVECIVTPLTDKNELVAVAKARAGLQKIFKLKQGR